MQLVLRPPTEADESVCRRLHEQLRQEDFAFVLAEGDWAGVLKQVAAEAVGTDLPPGRVRAEWLLAEVEGQVVGRTSIRYALTDHLRRVGGHVGYAVRPEYRRHGYATEIMRQSVMRLNRAGVQRVLVVCDDDNVGSAATIEKCGGVLENILRDGDDAPKRRYWIG